MTKLPDVTLVAVDCAFAGRTAMAMKACLAGCEFGEAKFLSSEMLPEVTNPIPKLDSSRKYSWFVLKELYRYVSTDFMLIFQHDGFILNPDAWEDLFLQYDYVGAPVSWGHGLSVGNGGFSLRSRRLMKEVAKIAETWDPSYVDSHPEDYFICEAIGLRLLEMGMRFAPVDVAARFACGRGKWDGEFGFHGVLTDISAWFGAAGFLGGRHMYDIKKCHIPEAVPGRDGGASCPSGSEADDRGQPWVGTVGRYNR